MKGYDEIDVYLLGEMSEEEKLQFEKELEEHDDLRKAFQLRKAIVQEIRSEYYRNLKFRLQMKEAEMQGKPVNFFYLLAASLCVIAVSVFLYILFKDPKPESFDFYESGIPNMMSYDNQKVDFHKGMNSFKMGEYDKAVSVFKNISGNSSDTVLYYLGVSLYRLEKYDQAIESFNGIILKPSSEFYEKSQYRLAILYFFTDKKEQSYKIMQSISLDKSHLFHQEAKDFIKNY